MFWQNKNFIVYCSDNNISVHLKSKRGELYSVARNHLSVFKTPMDVVEYLFDSYASKPPQKYVTP